MLKELAAMLPHAVSVSVECPKEPYDGDLQPGTDHQDRVDGLCAAISDVTGLAEVGVYLSLPVAAWAQS